MSLVTQEQLLIIEKRELEEVLHENARPEKVNAITRSSWWRNYRDNGHHYRADNTFLLSRAVNTVLAYEEIRREEFALAANRLQKVGYPEKVYATLFQQDSDDILFWLGRSKALKRVKQFLENRASYAKRILERRLDEVDTHLHPEEHPPSPLDIRKKRYLTTFDPERLTEDEVIWLAEQKKAGMSYQRIATIFREDDPGLHNGLHGMHTTQRNLRDYFEKKGV